MDLDSWFFLKAPLVVPLLLPSPYEWKKHKRNCKGIIWLIRCKFGNGNIDFFFRSFFMRLCTTTLTVQAWVGPTCIPQGSMYPAKAFTIINTKINSIFFIMNLYQLHNTYLFVFLDMLRCHHILYSIYGHEVFMSVFLDIMINMPH